MVVYGVTGGIGLLYFLATKFDIGTYRLARLTAFANPWEDPTGTGWQIIQSLYAIGSGGLFGVGLGNSTQKYLYLPEPQNDFIFAVIAEELGFIGCIIVIVLFAIFVWRGILIAMKAPDMFGSLIAVRNNISNRYSSTYKYFSCYIIYAKYRYAITIF